MCTAPVPYDALHVIVTVGVILTVAFSTYFERKVIGSMQARVGPNRVGPKGLLQPFADVIKLLIKEVIVPQKSNRFLFVIAPLLTLVPALAMRGSWTSGSGVIARELEFKSAYRRVSLVYRKTFPRIPALTAFAEVIAGQLPNTVRPIYPKKA